MRGPQTGFALERFHAFRIPPNVEGCSRSRARCSLQFHHPLEWGELHYKGIVLSISKREAYLNYIELPKRTHRPFQLAANIDPENDGGDRELLMSQGWELIDPWDVASSPNRYRDYISSSRAEIMCPKPIFKELNTGWISDRSVCYLASGRPVLAEDTCFYNYIPTGKGLLTFRNLSEAIEGVAEIDSNYKAHMNAPVNWRRNFLIPENV